MLFVNVTIDQSLLLLVIFWIKAQGVPRDRTQITKKYLNMKFCLLNLQFCLTRMVLQSQLIEPAACFSHI